MLSCSQSDKKTDTWRLEHYFAISHRCVFIECLFDDVLREACDEHACSKVMSLDASLDIQHHCCRLSGSAVVPGGNVLNKYVRLRGLTYIHTCRSYVHTPRELDRHAVESPTGTFIVLHAIRPISCFWGSKVHKIGRFPALDADEPPCKI